MQHILCEIHSSVCEVVLSFSQFRLDVYHNFPFSDGGHLDPTWGQLWQKLPEYVFC
jgi:hypothetical protein